MVIQEWRESQARGWLRREKAEIIRVDRSSVRCSRLANGHDWMVHNGQRIGAEHEYPAKESDLVGRTTPENVSWNFLIRAWSGFLAFCLRASQVSSSVRYPRPRKI